MEIETFELFRSKIQQSDSFFSGGNSDSLASRSSHNLTVVWREVEELDLCQSGRLTNLTFVLPELNEQFSFCMEIEAYMAFILEVEHFELCSFRKLSLLTSVCSGLNNLTCFYLEVEHFYFFPLEMTSNFPWQLFCLATEYKTGSRQAAGSAVARIL